MSPESGAERSSPLPLLAIRGAFGGLLMGLANLVPGISGGTMLLAAGVYPRFIRAVGEVTTFRFRRQSVVILAAVGLTALVAVAAFAGPVKDLVVDHRWIAYSLFIGLTLGGVPVLLRLIDRPSRTVWLGAAGGFAAMGLLALLQVEGAGGAMGQGGVVRMFLAGVAGASAMILPGVSGGYLLLVLGAYVPLLAGISEFVSAVGRADLAVATSVGARVLLPVGVGVVAGIAGVSNLLRLLLARYAQATYGVLLGLLVGAVLGLWPFQQGVAPPVGSVVKGQVVALGAAGVPVYQTSGEAVDPDDYPTEVFAPLPRQVAISVALIVVAFFATGFVDRLGRERPEGAGGSDILPAGPEVSMRESSNQAYRWLVRGRVQGVGFRHFTLIEGQRLGVGGWVRNLPDGRVEIRVVGRSKDVDELRRRVRSGPPAAKVEALEEEVISPDPGWARFEVRF